LLFVFPSSWKKGKQLKKCFVSIEKKFKYFFLNLKAKRNEWSLNIFSANSKRFPFQKESKNHWVKRPSSLGSINRAAWVFSSSTIQTSDEIIFIFNLKYFGNFINLIQLQTFFWALAFKKNNKLSILSFLNIWHKFPEKPYNESFLWVALEPS